MERQDAQTHPADAVGHAAEPLNVARIAECVGGELDGPAGLAITGLNTLERAAASDLTFIGDGKHAHRWAQSQAAAALVTRGVEVPGHDPQARALIVVDDADLAMAAVLELFAEDPPQPPVGIHPSACVDASAELGEGVRIGAFVYVGDGAKIGAGVTLHPRATVMDEAVIGDDSVIWPGAVVRERCLLGRRVVLHANVVIGADGFGYRPLPDGSGIKHIPHIGHVELGDDVEIGAGSAIDRGKFDATRVGAGTKIDNLVQVGHNCQVGRMCMLCGQVGLAGSVTVGDGAILGGNVGVADHISIGAGARLAARSGVIDDVPAGETWAGAPARPHRDLFRLLAIQRRMIAEHRRR
jgi:UDP-3-O-[3-hydroxymyristoyl] glucosamine N-acyltransferase